MKKTATIHVRTRPEIKATLLEIARYERRTPSDMIRELIREAGQRRGLWPGGVEVKNHKGSQEVRCD